MSREKKAKDEEKTESAENQDENSAKTESAEQPENQGENSAETEPDESAETEKSAEEKIAELQGQIDALKKNNDDLKDQVLRRAADFENYRKRALQENRDAVDYANTNLLKDLLESLDNFDRTVEAAGNATDPKTIADGVKMISRNLISLLENKYNLVSYGAAGDSFDPDIHEAIGSMQEAVAEPVLKTVYLKGYKLKDRVIRHAKVMVSMPDGSVKNENKNEESSAGEE
jgi:molecular chaperone GrpE